VFKGIQRVKSKCRIATKDLVKIEFFYNDVPFLFSPLMTLHQMMICEHSNKNNQTASTLTKNKAVEGKNFSEEAWPIWPTV